MSGSALLRAALLTSLVAVLPLRADLSRAKAEPNLERRARLALDNADSQFRLASGANKAGDWQKTVAALQEIRESVDLAYASLRETGKNPRDSRHYKNLEVKTRGLLKRIEELRRTMPFDQREQLEPLVAHLQKLHDEVLQSVMSPRRKESR
ncbi:MAG TPA: hypothetical protein VLH09_06335 [Bryobacteraceae bacterium]|nr:hypothetical protein [Bryobacteraceae bacterium]